MKLRFVWLALVALAPAVPAAAEPPVPTKGGCAYEITLLDAEARRLAVAMACDGDGPFELGTWRSLTDDNLRDVAAAGGSTLVKGTAWVLAGKGGVARATYNVDVDDMVRSTNSPAIAQRVGGSVVASARSFLLVPGGGRRPMRLALRFRAPPGAAVATALAQSGDALAVETRDFPTLGFMALGRIETFAVPVAGRNGAGPGTLTIARLDGPLAVPQPALARWFAASAARIGDYFGGFPVSRALIVLQPVPGLADLRRGIVVGGGGATMLLRIGSETRPEDLHRQWMLTHELVHFGQPFVGGHTWLMEGMAVYVETRQRVAAGWFPADRAWHGLLRNFRWGVPAMEQQGLAAARGIGPVYWGGTLFMLMADADILARTHGAKSLADCIRAVLDRGGDTTRQWTLDRFVAVCDAATGGDTFRRLVAAHVTKGTPLDLARLWQRLGVQLTADETGIVYNDKAPLAWVRKRIMAAPFAR
ncbi:MAG: hypothetical protein KIT16_10515 [Rhodospirillaceae bacterium]|nr:hypothetical protein [Rhodospirillaceae bacterium]